MKFAFEKKSGYSNIRVKNNKGLIITLTPFGAGIRQIQVPDRNGRVKTVTLSPLNDTVYETSYHGKTIGRTAGRICGASFTIDGKTADLEKNNFGTDNLHGGSQGLHVKKFSCQIIQEKLYSDIIFKRKSPDGEGGYFGEVDIKVTYRVYENENTFRVIFDCKSDIKTLVNLTNHVYWNLSGDLEESVTEQILYINAPEYGKLNERLIIEKTVPVTEEMNFLTPRKIGACIYSEDVQKYTKGYDHSYFLAPHKFSEPVSFLYSKNSGILLELRTTYPCIVFYADGQADGSVEVLPGKFDKQYLGACLECQYHPDGIHQFRNGCGIVSPDTPYHEETEYKFLISEIIF